MKRILLFAASLLLVSTITANGLLKNSINGNPMGTGSIDHFKLITDGTDVALVAAQDNSGSIFIIGLSDNDVKEQESNLVSEIPNYVDKIEAALGVTGIKVENIEINPKSRSIYILASKGASSYLLKATNKGNDLAIVDLSAVDYSKLTFSTNGLKIQDITYGGGKLYVSSGELFGGLKGEVAVSTGPFEHSSNMSTRLTSMFKTNWGGGFKTNAPIEKWDFASINGKDLLVGVTVCAPGFSFDPATIPGTGVLEVDEQFNLVNNIPKKVIHANQDGAHYLFNLHNETGGMLMRVGQHYIDGTAKTNNKHNANADYLRTFAGAVETGLTDADLKIYSTAYSMMAKYDDHNLLVLGADDKLQLLKVGTKDPEFEEEDVTSVVESGSGVKIKIFPNPVTNELKIQLSGEYEDYAKLTVEVIDLKGQVVIHENLSSGSFNSVSVDQLETGNYQVLIKNNGNQVHSASVIKK